MHPSLQLRNVHRLPLTTRERATAAIDGSLPDLRILCTAVFSGPATRHVLLLPVIYATLDPTIIPDLVTQFDLPPSTADDSEREMVVTRSALALSSLQRLCEDDVPNRAALTDLWARCWPWVQFLDACRERLNVERYRSRFCVETIIAMRQAANKHISGLVDATPGVTAVLVRGWGVILRDRSLPLRSAAFDGLCAFLEDIDVTVSQSLEDLFAGGGSRKALAALVLVHIKRAVAEASGNDDYLCCLRRLIAPNLSPDISFQKALMSQGIIKKLISAATRLLKTPLLARHPSFNSVLHILYSCIRYRPTHAGILPALDAGLLRLLIACGQQRAAVAVNHSILTKTIDAVSQSLVHRCVLDHLDPYLPALDRAEAKEAFRDCHHEPRIGTRAGVTAIFAGNWVACTTVRPRLLPMLLDFLRKTPGEVPCVLFDFTLPTDCGVTVGAASDLDARFPGYVSRAEKSDGRVQLHVMQVIDGWEKRLWMFPMRSASGDVMHALTEMARVPARDGVPEEGMEKLLALDVRETH
ncbi:hypothetical protein B0H15DRAFT_800753 [Mycena belliarum]|uniref:Uncharacterized protein n=1 Tax=Mycena belliarum TaxID=1033014 RepID=A0AAD6XM62_9AGAR|nr:hypothetical protein B0H15DRAFT_800753 [Mycena belliae]